MLCKRRHPDTPIHFPYGSGDLAVEGDCTGDAVLLAVALGISCESLSANLPASRPATPAATLSGYRWTTLSNNC
jgi:hypothetical protein